MDDAKRFESGTILRTKSDIVMPRKWIVTKDHGNAPIAFDVSKITNLIQHQDIVHIHLGGGLVRINGTLESVMADLGIT